MMAIISNADSLAGGPGAKDLGRMQISLTKWWGSQMSGPFWKGKPRPAGVPKLDADIQKKKTLLHAVPLKDQIWVCQRTGALYISLFDSSDCTSPTISIYPNADVAGMHREHDVPTVQSDLLTFLQKDSAVSLAV